MKSCQIRGFIAAIAVATCGVAVGSAQSNSAPQQKQNIVVNEKLEQKPKAEIGAKSNGKHEGIKVHGHWIIEVKDPDGKVATHREFENSLSPGAHGGASFLADLLLGYVVTGGFEIEMVEYPSGGGQEELLSIESLPCATTPPPNTQCSNGLTAAPISGGISLSGQIANVQFAGQIVEVITYGFICANNGVSTPSTMSPAGCAALAPTGNISFTGTSLGTNPPLIPVNVGAAGQTVQVTVQITFQ